jgi:hypothetical protein
MYSEYSGVPWYYCRIRGSGLFNHPVINLVESMETRVTIPEPPIRNKSESCARVSFSVQVLVPYNVPDPFQAQWGVRDLYPNDFFRVRVRVSQIHSVRLQFMSTSTRYLYLNLLIFSCTTTPFCTVVTYIVQKPVPDGLEPLKTQCWTKNISLKICWNTV